MLATSLTNSVSRYIIAFYLSGPACSIVPPESFRIGLIRLNDEINKIGNCHVPTHNSIPVFELLTLATDAFPGHLTVFFEAKPSVSTPCQR